MLTRAFHAIAHRPVPAILAPALLALALSGLGAALTGIPKPAVHDEFAYLLAADTFAAGRLTNPPHPMWQHFETMHVLHQPSYQAMYPPGQGLFLAAGQRLGHPVLGVWLSVAAMAAAFAWLLRAWLPPQWALVGALLAVAKIVILGRAAPSLAIGYWSQTYWGGAVAATGGALLYGALRRITRDAKPTHAFWLVSGLALLAVSRPSEGAIACVPAAVVLAVWLLRRRGPERRAAWTRVVAPLVVGSLVLAASLAHYNQRVTGDALKLPWVLNQEQYAVFPPFLFGSKRPVPEYRHDVLRQFHTGWELKLFERYRSASDFWRYAPEKLGRLYRFYVGPLLLLPLLCLPWVLRDRWMQLALVGCLAVLTLNLATVVVFPHYAAPAAGLFFVLVTAGLRFLWSLPGRIQPLARGAVAAIVGATIVLALLALPASRRPPTTLRRMHHRAEVVDSLAREGGRHLVLVRYQQPHSVHEEWVFNGADLDDAPVLFAREMDEASNRRLLDYYADRETWLLVVHDNVYKPRPKSYPRDGQPPR